MIPNLTAEAQLDALLRALESAGLGCTVVTDDGKKIDRVFANAPIARIFGLDVDAARALPPMDILAPGERERLANLRAKLAGGGTSPPSFIETAIVRADETKVPVEVAISYVPLDGAQAMFVFLRDNSEKANMEAALRDSERRFRSVAEASPDAIAIYRDARYEYANPVALRVLGKQSVEELADVDVRAGMTEAIRTEIETYMRRVRNGEAMPPLISRARNADGKDVIFETSLSLASLDDGPVTIAYARDVTERVALQAELMKQDRLASVGILAAGVAHELNNPLTTVSLQARKLASEAKQRELPEDIRASLEQIDEAAARLSSIISDLLFVARPSERPQTHVDVAQIIRSTISLFRAGTPKCPPIRVTADDLPPICGHASKLGQVLLNVLRNAAQALEGIPSGEIRVRAAPVGDDIEIVIDDDGPGISSDHLSRVAQPFFTTKPHGTGLGLWISHALVAEHGGALTIDSQGRGTRVSIRLPQRGPSAPAE